MPLPEFSGKSFPIAIDRRPSPYSTAEEDNASYASPGVFEDFLPPCTQVSTPETSWSLEEEPFTSWAPPVTMTSTVHPQAHIPDVSSPYGWSWPATTMGPAPIVSLEPVSTYPNVLNPATTSYESYPPMHSLHMYTHASNSSRSPAGQPRSSPTTLGAGPYQNQEAMVRSMDYRFQAPPSYHMQ
ncbi:hypothetical protein EJ04DRAFT_342924 [Polyplosphaeria fusca]|uniref:Uncharacterized protein n=1 Tax=Polyplosphaeria fusca TaxID=682080 RepID=A0A9P4QQY8_9PLEO|nr:hypothetical protein EJ04DRAFT_342924 [Polyplosphaeria fusca]